MASCAHAEKEEDVTYLCHAEIVLFGGFWLLRDFSGTEAGVAAIREGQLGDEDVLIASFPKSGNAWLQRIVSLIHADCDVTTANSKPLDEHVIYIDLEGLDSVLKQRELRIIKSHFNYRKIASTFRQGKGKIIYISRNPKDVIVSFFYFLKMTTHARLDLPFDEFCQRFIAGTIPYGPWLEHVKEYWSHRNDDNLLFLRYEDLKRDAKATIRDIGRFLKRDLSADQLDTIVRESSFTKMKENPATNYEWFQDKDLTIPNISTYMRKGIIGDWKNHFNPETSRQIDELVKRELSPLGLDFISE